MMFWASFKYRELGLEAPTKVKVLNAAAECMRSV